MLFQHETKPIKVADMYGLYGQSFNPLDRHQAAAHLLSATGRHIRERDMEKKPEDMTLDDVFDEYDAADHARLHEFVDKYPDEYEPYLIAYHALGNLAASNIPQRPPPHDPMDFIDKAHKLVRDLLVSIYKDGI